MQTQILFISKHAELLQTVLRLINNNAQWKADGSTEVEDAIQLFATYTYNLVILGNGLTNKEEETLVTMLQALQPTIQIIQHYGGGSGLLSNEIRAALENSNKGNVSIV
jgi:hypothetical protein